MWKSLRNIIFLSFLLTIIRRRRTFNTQSKIFNYLKIGKMAQ
ncbi:hypothetical protein D1BOALGB6SA_9483 [Olavius sp. associated proteobacterium Delta 1]|nr:hypothetical protein D1BOALGB6SA_9483 [Olavius sp. associated proteobacterium Delta 1]